VTMLDLARRYCALIENCSSNDTSWLKGVAELLPRLHAAVNCLNGREYKGNGVFAPDLDARFELYIHLVEVLGDRDSYWLEFDGVDDSRTMTGSLADDLTDIYCELKRGLAEVDAHLDPSGEDAEPAQERPRPHWMSAQARDREPKQADGRDKRYQPTPHGRCVGARKALPGGLHRPPGGTVEAVSDPVIASVHQAWRESFAHHWGRHLIDATRHLSVLDAQGRLD